MQGCRSRSNIGTSTSVTERSFAPPHTGPRASIPSAGPRCSASMTEPPPRADAHKRRASSRGYSTGSEARTEHLPAPRGRDTRRHILQSAATGQTRDMAPSQPAAARSTGTAYLSISALNQSFCFLRWRDHHHQFRCSAGRRGSRACATAQRSVSRTQRSCLVPVLWHSAVYSSSPSQAASWVTLWMPSVCRSASTEGPTPARSRSRRLSADMECAGMSFSISNRRLDLPC